MRCKDCNSVYDKHCSKCPHCALKKEIEDAQEVRKCLLNVTCGDTHGNKALNLLTSPMGTKLLHLGYIEFKRDKVHETQLNEEYGKTATIYLKTHVTPKGFQALGYVHFEHTCDCGEFTWDNYFDPDGSLHTLCPKCDAWQACNYVDTEWVPIEKEGE